MAPKNTQNTEAETSTDDTSTTRYELMVLIHPDANEDEYKKQVAEVKSMVESQGGSIWHEENWGKRDLAYAIKKQTSGYYMIFNFDMAPSGVSELSQQLRIVPFVMRSLLIKVPKEYTPQTYDLDATKPDKVVDEEKSVIKMTKKPLQESSSPEKPLKKETKVKEEAPKEEEAPKKEAEKIEKLDEKLDKLLSNDEDLNL